MNNLIVQFVNNDGIMFTDGNYLTSEHQSDCCEHHYISFENLDIKDFEGLVFNLSTDKFLERIDGYGIALHPIAGLPIRVPGYGYNNGCYGTNIDLVLNNKGNTIKTWDVSECQVIIEG